MTYHIKHQPVWKDTEHNPNPMNREENWALMRDGRYLATFMEKALVDKICELLNADEDKQARIVFLLSCADNPARYLGRDGTWVEFILAPCFPTAQEALAWRSEMARAHPTLNLRSNAVLEVKEMRPGTIKFKTLDDDGKMHPWTAQTL